MLSGGEITQSLDRSLYTYTSTPVDNGPEQALVDKVQLNPESWRCTICQDIPGAYEYVSHVSEHLEELLFINYERSW